MYYIKQLFNYLIDGIRYKEEEEEDYNERLKNAGKTLEKYKKFKIIPSELIIELSIYLPYKDLFRFIKTNKKVYNILKSSNYLWMKKFSQEFGENPIFPKVYGGPNPLNWFEASVDFITILGIIKDNLIHYEEIENVINVMGNELLREKVNEIIDNEKIVLKSVERDGITLKYASDRLKNKFSIVYKAVQNNGLALKYASDTLKDHNYFLKKVVDEAVQENGLALQYASDRLKNEYYIVIYAVQENGLALQYASDRLKDNLTIVSEAINQNGLALQFASDRVIEKLD